MTQNLLTTTNQQLALYNLSTTQALQTKNILPSLVFQATYTPNGLIYRTTRDGIRPLASFLRNSSSMQATILVDIIATDKLDKAGRFSVKYSFLSVLYNRRFIVELFTDETLSVPSLTSPFINQQKIFASAG